MSDNRDRHTVEAGYQQGNENERVVLEGVATGSAACLLCPQHCRLRPGQVGRCQARGNQEGGVVSLTYGEVATMHNDPVEKKPLYHFYPGSWIFSAAGYGCNLSCSFCQNHEISQARHSGQRMTPKELALEARNSLGLCFTYSEPTMWYEMIRETAPLVRAQGGKVALVSNGTLSPYFLEELIPWIDAVNIDIKGFSEDFYRTYCGGKLKWVLENVERMAGRVHLEVTTLIIPGGNDSREEIRALSKWLEDLETPLAWHLSRYFPAYRLTRSATEPQVMAELWQIARERLPYVYLGNVLGGSSTFCPHCGEEVIKREGWNVRNTLHAGACPQCGQEIFGQGM